MRTVRNRTRQRRAVERHAGERHLVTTKARARHCPSCRAHVIVGIAEGMPASVDPYPLDRDREIDALVEGRRTYTLMAPGELVHRTADRVNLAGPVLADHRCTNEPAPPTQPRQPVPDTEMDPATRRAVGVLRRLLDPNLHVIHSSKSDDNPPF